MLQNWDGELLVSKADAKTRSTIYIAIHSSKYGPATGGTRMMHYQREEDAINDALNLSRSMTHKFIGAGFPRGGGKAVINIPGELGIGERTHLLSVYGKMIQQLNGIFYCGPDVGTSTTDMDVISEFAPGYVFGTSKQKGGAGSSAPATARGVYYCMKSAASFLFGNDSLKDKIIIVQGIGNVGRSLIDMLKEENAIVLVSDIAFGSDMLMAHGCPVIPVESVYKIDCDIFSPCALGGTLTTGVIQQMKCRAIVGAANNQVADEDAVNAFQERDILYAPDFLVNSGGAVGITGMEALGWSWEMVEEKLQGLSKTLYDIFVDAKRKKVSTQSLAIKLVEETLQSPGYGIL